MGYIYVPSVICSIHSYMRNRQNRHNTNGVGCGTSWQDKRSCCNTNKTYVFPKQGEQQVVFVTIERSSELFFVLNCIATMLQGEFHNRTTYREYIFRRCH